LQDADYEFETAANGMDALNKARRLLPDVILMDLLLPDLDGLTLCEILRRQPSTRGTPVIMLSAVDTAAARYSAQTVGARQYLSKPVDWPVLKAAVRSALASVAAREAEADDEEI
jgi:DNA-binding response OmpR family regulator